MPTICTDRFKLTYRPEIVLTEGLTDSDYTDLELPYSSNIPIDEPNLGVTGILMVLHGDGGDAAGYLDNALGVISKADFMLDVPLIIAPQFINESEVTGPIPPNALYWDGGRFWGGGSGDTLSNPRNARVRSFDALDWLLEDLCDPHRFPNLKQIVIAGHSGGGQLINRYAASSPFSETIAHQRSVDVKHICINAGDYLYLSDQRPADGTVSRFTTGPSHSCPKLDKWGTGLQSLWGYPRRSGSVEIKNRYQNQNVTYLVGSEDIESSGNCASMAQGSTRLERAIAYYLHLVETFGVQIAGRQKLAIVPGVGHWGYGMMTSEVGVAEIAGPFGSKPSHIRTSIASRDLV